MVVLVAVVVGAGGIPGPTAQAAAVPESFLFSGSGWGHGIGMSQYGAYGQALEGRSAVKILEHYYNPAKVTRTTNDPTIDVQVLNSRSSVKITAQGGRLVMIHGRTEIPADEVTFTVKNGEIVGTVGAKDYAIDTALVLRWTGSYDVPSGATATTTTVPYAHADSGAVRYRHGELRVGVLNGRPNVVNRVRMNTHYLYGLAEMPSSWPAAALQSQAIAGRTYALRKVNDGIRTTCGCHVTDETTDQKFTAWNKENETTYGPRWRAAVDATISSSGAQVITHSGALIQAYYSSSTGGMTSNNEDVWGGTALPYLRTRDDHWSQTSANPRANWTATKTQAQVASIFGLPDVARLQVTKRASSGAVMQVRATSSTGTRKNLVSSARSDSVRTALGLNSAYFSIGKRAAVERFGGADRYETAVALGREAFPSGSEVVLVAGAPESVIDGLVAAPFAYSRGAPLLLAARDGLPKPTRDELVRRGPSTVWLVGGAGVLGPKLVAELKAMGIAVKRVAGDDRFETAARVAREMGAASGRVVFASGASANVIDSAAVGGVAAATGRPILLTLRDSVPKATLDAVKGMGVKQGYLIGGGGAVSQKARGFITDLGVSTTRLGGDDRYETAAAVATAFAPTVGATTVLLAGATDRAMVDALTGGVLGNVTLLTNRQVQPVVGEWFASHDVNLIRVAGGTGSVPTAVVEALRVR